MVEERLKNIRDLRTPSGLFLAAGDDGSTGYNKVWLRDNCYVALAFAECGKMDEAVNILHGILDILHKHKEKIVWAAKNKPTEAWQCIHARYNPETQEEFHDPWGNKQNDAVGMILYMVGDIHLRNGKVLRGKEDIEMMELLVRYLDKVEYWDMPDNGMWEESEEVHASSIGACVAGLEKISYHVNVPIELIDIGVKELYELLPRESKSRFVDLSLLSLIYPYNLVSPKVAMEIIESVEYHLVRKHGVIRYKGDRYYNADKHGGEEAEWSMGFPWLALAHLKVGNMADAHKYLVKAKNTIYEGKIPELYYSNSFTPNGNIPLAWAEGLYAIALKKYEMS